MIFVKHQYKCSNILLNLYSIYISQRYNLIFYVFDEHVADERH